MRMIERMAGLKKIFFAGLAAASAVLLYGWMESGGSADLRADHTAAAVERPLPSSPASSVSLETMEAAPPSVPQTISDADFDRMVAEMQRAALRYPPPVSIYVKNLATGREWTFSPDRLMPSASLIKVPVMLGVYEKLAKGELRLDDSLVLTRQVRRLGSGHLKHYRTGSRFTVEELLETMITHSDNTAQEMLIRAVGLDYLQTRFPAYGLQFTNITRQGLSLSSWTRVENYTTAREMAGLLESLYAGESFGPALSAEMLERMKRVKYRDRLTRYLPSGWSVAHKTGLLRKSCHDVGIVYSPAGDYILCVMTTGVPRYRDAKQFISRIGAISYKYFKKVPSTSSSRAG